MHTITNKVLLAFSVSTLLLLTGCAQKQDTKLPNLDLPTKQYENSESLAGLSFSMTQPVVTINTNLSNYLMSALEPRIQYDTDLISCQLTNELQKILISKGFTINHIFKSQNDMTFSEKRNTSALIFPTINVSIQESTLTTYYDGVPAFASGDLIISMNVAIYMIEPLSNEKIWMKDISINTFTVPVRYNYSSEWIENSNLVGEEYIATANAVNNFYGNSNSLVNSQYISEEFVGTATSVDDFYKKLYAHILELADKHITAEEFQLLNSDIQKLKNIKRY